MTPPKPLPSCPWHVCYATDANYAFLVGISICSLCETNREAPNIHFHILDNGITDDQKRKLQDLAIRYNRHISFYSVEAPMREVISAGAKLWNNSYATWARLFLGRILPPGIDRVLYLDADTLILRPLAEMFAFSIPSPFVMAAAKDCCQLSLPEPGGGKNPYFNAGVLLIQLDRWRDARCEEELLRMIHDTHGNLPCVDQGILNAAMSLRIRALPLAYDVFSWYPCIPWRWLLRIYALAPSDFYPEDEYVGACSSPAIVHMMGSIVGRPWESGNTNPFLGEFRRFKAISSWADEPDWPHIQNCDSLPFRFQRALYRCTPRSFYCAVTTIASRFRLRAVRHALIAQAIHFPSPVASHALPRSIFS